MPPLGFTVQQQTSGKRCALSQKGLWLTENTSWVKNAMGWWTFESIADGTKCPSLSYSVGKVIIFNMCFCRVFAGGGGGGWGDGDGEECTPPSLWSTVSVPPHQPSHKRLSPTVCPFQHCRQTQTSCRTGGLRFCSFGGLLLSCSPN